MKMMMTEMLFFIVIAFCVALLVKACVDAFMIMRRKTMKSSSSHAPGDGPLIISTIFRVPIIGALLWLRKSSLEIEATLRSLRSNDHVLVPPAITIRFLFGRSLIFVFSRSLAHRALVDHGAVFSDRPKPSTIDRLLSGNQHSINTAGYGDMWRTLRRNLTSKILNPSKLKTYSGARSWVLDVFTDRLMAQTSSAEEGNGAVRVIDHFRYAMFCLLVLMCFGDKLDEDEIRKIESVQHGLLSSVRLFSPLNLKPTWLTKVMFRGRWEKFYDLIRRQESVMIPYIRQKKEGRSDNNIIGESVFSYLDSLLDLEMPDDGDQKSKVKKTRKLTEVELVSACSEFLNAGTDTTTTALQWIMAQLVKNPQIQAKLYDEIKGAGIGEVVKEEDLSKMLYLKAVVLEGLRRHPPGHFLLPHAVTQDVEVDGFHFPKNSTINFMVADIGCDGEVWDDPLQFKPERFLPCLSSNGDGGQFDITGTRDIKMMPFGAGRRMCPASIVAILHLEYFVANMIWRFEWKEVDGYQVDLSEEQEFAIVMKYPLHAQILPRIS